jgi:hypothetical protein
MEIQRAVGRGGGGRDASKSVSDDESICRASIVASVIFEAGGSTSSKLMN